MRQQISQILRNVSDASERVYICLRTVSFLLFCAFTLIFASCRTSPTDMRTIAPAETIVYLESEDLGGMFESLTEGKAFNKIAKTKPDFSMLKNAQSAIVVTGFETSEKKLTEESAILHFKPQFVLIADTHAWERTNISLVENQIGQFVTKTYGDSVKLEKSEKSEAKFFVWTAEDGRKIYAAVIGSLIYVGNNENTIDKCLAVKRGEADNLSKNESLTQARERGRDKKIAFGYISFEGIAQLANLAGVSVAVDVAEEDLTKSFIARILPPLLQKTVREISWTARKTEEGIEDKIYIKTDGQVSDVWKETLVPVVNNQFRAAEFIPANFDSITRYNLQNPQIAWRSILLTLSNKLDTLDGKIWIAASGSFFAPYGIADAETFLSAINAEIITARLDRGNNETIAIVEVKDKAKIKSSLTKEINFNTQPEKISGATIWKSADGELTAAFIEEKIILGNRSNVLNCLKAKEGGQNLAKTAHYQSFVQSNAVTTTVTKDAETAGKIVNVFGNVNEEKNSVSFYTTETRFNSNGIERRTVSDFGLIGTLLEKFNSSE